MFKTHYLVTHQNFPIMNSYKVKNILGNILNGKKNFCALCFNNIEILKNAVRFTDRVILTNNEENRIVDIYNFIFRNTMSSDLLTSVMCKPCAQSTISSYTFIKMCMSNTEYLTTIMKNMKKNVNSSLEENLEFFKTMYLLNDEKCMEFYKYYDTKCEIKSISAASVRFQTIISEEYNKDNICIELVPEQNNSTTIKHIKRKNGLKTIKQSKVDNMYEEIDGGNVKCKECHKTYPAILNFRKHYIRVHGLKTFKCPKCPKYFASVTILKQHKSESHMEAVCLECGKIYNNRQFLKIHELSHKFKYVCYICKRVYKSVETYNAHLHLNICNQRQRKTQLDAKFTCDICNKKFCRKASLRVHINFEHENSKAHVCKWCNKTFSALSRLNAHIVKHTQVKNFSCTICNGKFVTKQSLMYHIRTHTGEKPYKCHYCDASFISSSRRSAHTNCYHSNHKEFNQDMNNKTTNLI